MFEVSPVIGHSRLFPLRNCWMLYVVSYTFWPKMLLSGEMLNVFSFIQNNFPQYSTFQQKGGHFGKHVPLSAEMLNVVGIWWSLTQSLPNPPPPTTPPPQKKKKNKRLPESQTQWILSLSLSLSLLAGETLKTKNGMFFWLGKKKKRNVLLAGEMLKTFFENVLLTGEILKRVKMLKMGGTMFVHKASIHKHSSPHF